jgi:uncharacterized protein YxeA
MKKHKKLIIIILIVIVLIVSVVAFFIIKSKKAKSFGGPQGGMNQFMKEDMDENGMKDFGQMSENETDKTDKQSKNTTTLKTTSEIKSALTEDIELHATYYLEEVYVDENDFVEAGKNILKYTNGTYLVAPYDCYIIELNLPDIEGKVLNSHYVEISSSNSLMVIMNVDETNIENVSVGLEATIEVTSLDKTYKGNVTNIASTGSNGKFEIEIEFENDGDIKIGMTGTISITI